MLVTTDSKGIANISKDYGADVPFIRPKHWGQENSSTLDEVMHGLSHYKEKSLLRSLE